MSRFRHRRALVVVAGFFLSALLLVLGLNAYVLLRAGGATSDVARLKHAQVAIVPGALVDAGGRMSAMLADRVDGAVRLYRAGRVDRILVSGDHGHLGYDETDTMRDAVLARGVPARDVFTDYAGFDTWSTMVRARTIFQVDSAIVVTQGFHMARALYLAGQAGLDAQGFRRPPRLRRQGHAERRSRGAGAGEGRTAGHRSPGRPGGTRAPDNGRRTEQLGSGRSAGAVTPGS